MKAAELKAELEKTTAEYRALDSDYRQHILKYAINLIVAEVAVVGFLLQNETTQRVLGHFLPKLFLLASLLTTLSSVCLSILAKRIRVDSERTLMDSYTYRLFSRLDEFNVNISGMEAPADVKDQAEENANDSVKKFMLSTNKIAPILSWSEYCMIAGTLFAILLVVYLVIKV